jgi:hypothetical protein
MPVMTTATKESQERATDRRGSLRRRVMKSAKIAFGDFIFVRDCHVRDVAPNGARIKVGGAHEIPDEFHLVVTADRSMRKVRVMWRTTDEIGVEYEGEARDVTSDPDPRLRQFRFG